MADMRSLMRLVEGLQPVNEIERGGEVDSTMLDDLEAEHDYTPDQLDLFPEIPSLELKLPKGFEQVGRIGTYFVTRRAESTSKNGDPEHTYYVFDKAKPIAYTALLDPSSNFGDGYGATDPMLGGKGLRTVSVYIAESHRGKDLGIALYEWVLTNVCDYLLPDSRHTPGGEYLWKKMLNSKKFEVMVFDPRTYMSRRRRSGKDFEQIYRNDDLCAWVTLAGKASRLMHDDDVGDFSGGQRDD